jgi:hypothetical protein
LYPSSVLSLHSLMLSRFMHLGEVHTLAWKIMFIYWLW